MQPTGYHLGTSWLTLRPIKCIQENEKIVRQIAHWYNLARSWPALQRFKQGYLSSLGVLKAILESNAFTEVFCFFPADRTKCRQFSNTFTVMFSPEGSNKRASENVVLSYWNDYLQEMEDDETKSITLNDVLLFLCSCKPATTTFTRVF